MPCVICAWLWLHLDSPSPFPLFLQNLSFHLPHSSFLLDYTVGNLLSWMHMHVHLVLSHSCSSFLYQQMYVCMYLTCICIHTALSGALVGVCLCRAQTRGNWHSLQCTVKANGNTLLPLPPFPSSHLLISLSHFTTCHTPWMQYMCIYGLHICVEE